jgi:hypothetical protein
MTRWLKRTGVEMLIGAVVGFVLWCLAGKSMTSMMYGSLGGSFSCQTDVETALTRFLSMQLYSAIGGAIVFAIAIGLIRRALERRKLRSAGSSPAQSGASSL